MTKAGAPTSALVADDDVEFRTFLVEFLRSEGFEVAEAANGLETLLHVKRHRPRFVVLDVHMPRLGGLDALRRIRAWDPSIAVLVVTGMPDDELQRQAVALSAAGFFAKPLDGAKLLETTRSQGPLAPGHAPLSTPTSAGQLIESTGQSGARSSDAAAHAQAGAGRGRLFDTATGAPTGARPVAGRVLVVDDDRDIRTVVEACSRRRATRCRWSRTGRRRSGPS